MAESLGLATTPFLKEKPSEGGSPRRETCRAVVTGEVL